MNYDVEFAVESAVRLAVHQSSVSELDIGVSNKNEMHAMLGYIVDFVISNLTCCKLDLEDEKYAFICNNDTDVVQFKIIGDNGEETYVVIYIYDNTDEDEFEKCNPGLMLLNLSSVCIFNKD